MIALLYWLGVILAALLFLALLAALAFAAFVFWGARLIANLDRDHPGHCETEHFRSDPQSFSNDNPHPDEMKEAPWQQAVM